MGLFRLWWVPQGHPPTEGTYVRYDAEAMLAVLVLEATRAGAVVIGEDLGTVEPGVREVLRERGVLGTSVLWFERDWEGDGRPLPPERWRADCLATATTHDLPPTASRLTGEHVELRDSLGLLTRPLDEERAEAAADAGEWLELLARLGLLHGTGGGADPSSEEAQIQAVHRFLLRTPARMVGIWLPDTVGDHAAAEPAGYVGPVSELAAADRRRGRARDDAGGPGGLGPPARAGGGTAGAVGTGRLASLLRPVAPVASVRPRRTAVEPRAAPASPAPRTAPRPRVPNRRWILWPRGQEERPARQAPWLPVRR